jgi:hypothetical protein
VIKTWVITAKVKGLATAANGSSVNRLVTIDSVCAFASTDAVKFTVARK